MRRLRPLWIGVLGATLVACATLVGTQGRRERIKIPHQTHLKAEVDCLACHETVFDATSLTERNLPPEKKCLECHKEEFEKKNCGFCHVGEPATYAPVTRHLFFNHAVHLEQDEDCGRCHQRLPEPGVHAHLTPQKAICNGCHVHQEQFDNGQCQVCHQDLQRYPLRPITAFTHGPDYLHRHAKDARAGQACGTCHQQSFCSECHARPGTVPLRAQLLNLERVDRSFIHRNDFINRHPVEARADPSLCLKCHDTPSCDSCHAARGLSGQDPWRNPHPAGYALGPEHGRDARQNIGACAGCHDQGAQSVCVDCHRSGGVGGNPHPASWLRRHGSEEIERNATCIACHR